MTDTFTVDTSQLVALGQRYAGAAPIIEEELLTASRRVILVVEGLAKRYVRVDQRHLRRSITSDARPIAGGVRAVAGTNVPYARIVEGMDESGKLHQWSRRPGMPPPPQGALLGWMRRHGMPPEAETALRFSIARKGIKARPYLTRALSEVRPQANAEFAQVSRRVILRLGAGP